MTTFHKVLRGLHKNILSGGKLKEASAKSITYINPNGERKTYKDIIDKIDLEVEEFHRKQKEEREKDSEIVEIAKADIIAKGLDKDLSTQEPN